MDRRPALRPPGRGGAAQRDPGPHGEPASQPAPARRAPFFFFLRSTLGAASVRGRCSRSSRCHDCHGVQAAHSSSLYRSLLGCWTQPVSVRSACRGQTRGSRTRARHRMGPSALKGSAQRGRLQICHCASVYDIEVCRMRCCLLRSNRAPVTQRSSSGRRARLACHRRRPSSLPREVRLPARAALLQVAHCTRGVEEPRGNPASGDEIYCLLPTLDSIKG